ncbi:MAG: kelch motif-containing protein, partial [Thermoplasmata archaeon]|nr:kelch motif-containing protein [Thermoplasmata archaeon]
ASNLAILFGGCSTPFPCGSILGDTWTVSSTIGWTKLTLSPSPPPRWGGSMVWDPTDLYVLLFGGVGCTAGPCGDTWTFSGTGLRWTPLPGCPPACPSARWDAAMTWDATNGHMVLFGGYPCGTTTCSDTWTYVTGVWTKLTLTVAPLAATDGVLAYTSAGGPIGYVLYFGGDGSFATGTTSTSGPPPNGDTWTYLDTPGWVVTTEWV